MARPPLLEALQSRGLCADGAMGTELLARGLASGDCGMLWNVENPSAVAEIHAAYRKAGCNLITTNSFGGTASALARHGLESRTVELNRAAAELAHTAAGADGWVLGDVGPFGDFLEPVGDMEPDTLRDIFLEQIHALLAGGADAILVETMSDPAEAVVGIEAARQADADVPVVATFAFQKTGDGQFRTMMGTDPAAAVRAAIDAGASIAGANCGTDLTLDDYVTLAGQLVAAAGDTPVIIQPNAGAPRVVDGRSVHDATPAQMRATADRLFSMGVRIIGGCCGTTPAHLAAMSGATDHCK